MVKAKLVYPALVFFVSLIVCGQNIGGASVYILDEAKNATCAREMMEGDHIVPTFNGELRTDKPPLHYYFMMLSYKSFGVSAFSARFFSAVFGAFTVLITFLYTRKLLSPRAGWLAAGVLLCSTHFVLQFHLAVPDPYLIFFTTLAGFSFTEGFIRKKKGAIYLAYLSIGLGILAKGPVAIALPGLAIAVFIIFSGNFSWQTIKTFRPVSGLFLALLIAVPWYAGVGIKTEWVWIKGFFLDHNLDRFNEPMEGHGGGFWLTLVFVTGGLLPASAYIAQGFGYWWKKRKDDFIFFSGCFAVVTIVFFAIADTRLPNYTVPAYPFLAVLISGYLDNCLIKKEQRKWFTVSSAIILLIMILLPTGVYAGLSADPALEFLRAKSGLLVPLMLLGGIGFFYLSRNNVKVVLITIAAGFAFFTFIALNVLYPQMDAQNPVAKILPKINTGRPIAYFHRFNPSFAFYLEKKIPNLQDTVDVNSFFEKHPDGILITRSDFSGRLSELENLSKVYEEQDLFETTKTVVYRRK